MLVVSELMTPSSDNLRIFGKRLTFYALAMFMLGARTMHASSDSFLILGKLFNL